VSGELASEKRQFILVQEHQVAGCKLVYLQSSVGTFEKGRAFLGGALSFAKLASSTLGRADSGGSHLDA
jgi:hypothetical protein